MYGYLWRLIPGPFIVKLIVTLIVAIAVFFLLMEVVFPWGEHHDALQRRLRLAPPLDKRLATSPDSQ